MMNYIYAIGAMTLVLLILIVVCFKKLNQTQQKYEKLIANTEGESLDEIVISNKEAIRILESNLKIANERADKIQQQLNTSLQKTGFKRYNAFHDMGSNMSFSMALLNDELDGIVISSLYGRDGCSLYGKSVESGKSTYILSDEEDEVLKAAIKK